MQDSGLFMMSPMGSAGEDRLRRARACIRKTFGPVGTGRRTKRALEMPAEAPAPAKTPRTKLRQRIERASHASTEQLFFHEFGSREELMSTEFDLARPAGNLPSASARYAGAVDAAYPAQQTAGGPTSYFSLSSAAPTSTAFTSSLPAPSTASVSQLARPSRIRTPRKAAIKRGRAGESSAEKELVLRKPRLGGAGSRSIDYSSAGSSFGAQPPVVPGAEARKRFAFVTNRGDHLTQPSAMSNRFFSRTSPSKFQFSSNASRLFSQRQAPLR